MNEEIRQNYIKLFSARARKGWVFLIPRIRKCNACGKKYLRMEYKLKKEISEVHNYVKEHEVCFECGYWLYLIEHKPEGLQIANGICYKILPFVEKPGFTIMLGSKGKTFFFVTKEKEVIKSNDVWRIGKIPERFRDRLPDTGWFCDRRVYEKLSKFNKPCKAMGCLDRYKCFRFNTELELENGPFNEVPKNWITGGEHCKHFLNTDLIENYVSSIQIGKTNGKRTKNKND